MRCSPPRAARRQLDKVSFGTNWVAEAEHGGFYQAVADGTYRKYGLDVTIVPGGPQVNNRMLLLAGKIDFFMSANSLQSFDAVAQNIPTIAVAAIFQKEPQVLLAHPGRARRNSRTSRSSRCWSRPKGCRPISNGCRPSSASAENKVKPYTFNPQPFLVDKKSAMQGYVTSEPFAVEKAGKFKPKIFLLADHGFNTYSTLDRDAPRNGRETARPGAALRRCLGDRLVQLSLWRQQGRERADPQAQSGNEPRS